MKPSDALVITPQVTLEPDTSSVVILGANGTGKSMIGVVLARRGAYRIAALRALEIPDNLPFSTLNVAQHERSQQVRQFGTNRRLMAHDFHATLSELQAEALERGRQIREQMLRNPVMPDRDHLITRLDHVVEVWESLFPGRKLSFEDGQPRVTTVHSGAKAIYAQSEMSDGERQALYLAAKLATAPEETVIVVDEPETHLHPTLARRLWDRLELLKPKSRFVYITHDLPFAVGRRPETIVACRADGSHEVAKEIPQEIAIDILGALSLPVTGDRVFFCEGTVASRDCSLLESWFKNTVGIWPVGSCDNVVGAVVGLKKLPLKNCAASGMMDRDLRCSEEIELLERSGIHVLGVAIVEHLYALPDVFRAVLAHLGKTPQEQEDLVRKLRDAVVGKKGPGIHEIALQRAKERSRWKLRAALGEIEAGPNKETAEANLCEVYARDIGGIDLRESFAVEFRRVQEALGDCLEVLLREIPWRGVVKEAAHLAGLEVKMYIELVEKALRGELPEVMEKAVEAALAPHLPPR